MKNSYFFIALAWLLIICNSCKENTPQNVNPYIAGYTHGTLKSGNPIYIYLSQPANKSFQTGSTLPEEILSFSPAIKGETVLKDEYTVIFTPSAPLKNGETYNATFHVGNLCEVEKGYEQFLFQIKVIPLSILYEPGISRYVAILRLCRPRRNRRHDDYYLSRQ